MCVCVCVCVCACVCVCVSACVCELSVLYIFFIPRETVHVHSAESVFVTERVSRRVCVLGVWRSDWGLFTWLVSCGMALCQVMHYVRGGLWNLIWRGGGAVLLCFDLSFSITLLFRWTVIINNSFVHSYSNVLANSVAQVRPDLYGQAPAFGWFWRSDDFLKCNCCTRVSVVIWLCIAK